METTLRRADEGGTFWRQGLELLVEWVSGEVWVTPLDRGLVVGARHVVVASGVSFTRWMFREGSDVSKWLAKAVAAVKTKTTVGPAGSLGLFEGRPALEEFMRLLEDDEGLGRDPSVLMVAVSAAGLRVGLKDEASGGWLWREGDDLAGGLDALEKALQGGRADFRAAGGQGRKRKP
jgi:hypothetical protein